METKPPVVHWDDLKKKTRTVGDISSTWTLLGEAAGTVNVGLRRIEVVEGMRTTALHVHGAEEEIFFVLGGSGLLHQGETTCEVKPGDCIVHLAEKEPHTLRGGKDGLDVLVFGMRVPVEICYLPRAEMAWAGPTVVSAPGILNLWEKDAARGPLEFPPPGPRPANVVGLDAAPSRRVDRKDRHAIWRSIGRAAGAVRTGLNHVTLEAGSTGAPAHCHSTEEEIFVVLEGDGICTIGSDDFPLRRGHVVSRPAGTGIAHSFLAGANGLVYLAYGTRETSDITYYPRSKKFAIRGIGLIGRIESLDYWDGED
jgi:uncharacterized cupin superfamily protein